MPGGIGNHAENLGLALHEKMYQVTILVFDRGKKCHEWTEYDRSKPYRVIRVERSKNVFVSYYQRIKNIRKESRSNDFIVLSGKSALWMQLFMNKAATAVLHGSELLLQNKGLRYLTNKAISKTKNSIAVSNFTKGLLDIKLQPQCVVINNGVNLEEFDLQVKTKSKPIDFITVGTIHQRKGQHNVIAALPALLARFENCHYHMVGINNNSTELKHQIKELKLDARVTIYGSLKRERMLEKVKECTIGIMLSENTGNGDVEGFGISLIEANAMGLPTIGSKGTGIEDAIRNNFNGVLVEAKTVDEIVGAVEIIINDYEQYSKNAIAFAEQCSWHLRVDDYIKQIES